MPIRFTCPSCGRTMRADDTWAGRKARCPGCQQLVEVPAADSVPAATPAAPAQTSAPPRATAGAAPQNTVPRAPAPRQPAAPVQPQAAPAPKPAAPASPAKPAAAPVAPAAAAPKSEKKLVLPEQPVVKREPRPKPQPAAEAGETEKPAAKPAKRAAVVATDRPAWQNPKLVGIGGIALSTLGFLLFWLPIVGLALSGLGILTGLIASGLSLRDRGAGLGYGLAGICVGMVALVPGLVRTRQVLGQVDAPPAVTRSYSAAWPSPRIESPRTS